MNVSEIYYLNAGEQIEFCVDEGGTGSQIIYPYIGTYVYGFKIY